MIDRHFGFFKTTMLDNITNIMTKTTHLLPLGFKVQIEIEN